MSGSIYLIAHPVNVFQKIHDTGKEIKEGYLASTDDKMYAPMGLLAGGSLVWIADHGPGPGPFWDSGGGNEIILFWDNGEKLVLLERYGTGGKARDRLEFINPCATVQSPDHMEFLCSHGASDKLRVIIKLGTNFSAWRSYDYEDDQEDDFLAIPPPSPRRSAACRRFDR